MTTPVAQRQTASGWSAHKGHERSVVLEEQPVSNRKSATQGNRYLSGMPCAVARGLATSPGVVIALPANAKLT